MGNASSRVRHQGCSTGDHGVLFLLYKTWAVVVPDFRNGRYSDRRTPEESGNAPTDVSDFGSQYSFCSCSQCDRENFFSECSSDGFGPIMAPNSDESGRLVPLAKSNKSNWTEDTLSREKQRPPIYNPEDYAISLKKWGRRPGTNSPGLYSALSTDSLSGSSCQNTPSDCANNKPGHGAHNGTSGGSQRDYRNPMLTSNATGEMTLRQFGTVSELLVKLRADLRLAFPSFVQEFIGDPLDGVTLLLELLRAIQLSQASGLSSATPASTVGAPSGAASGVPGGVARVPPAVQRRALLDELACLQCLHCCCLRYSDAVRRMTASSAGLFTLAVCIMSNVNKSRILALELLTKACEPIGNGHSPVSEALSTLRLRFGEPVRFRFLVGMLTSAGQCELLTAGLKFLNTFLDTSGTLQRRLYIQAELEQAGFDIDVIKKIININSSSSDLVFTEVERWEKGHIDIDSFSKKVTDVEKENGNLREKITLLERRVQILQEEKGVLKSLEQCLKERCCVLQDEVTSLKSEKQPKKIISRDSSIKIGSTSPAEDEGISSSERSLTPDDIQREPLVYELYNVQNETFRTPPSKETKKSTVAEMKKLPINDDDEEEEEEETTIEEVIEELRNIINDAETEAYATERKEAEERRRLEEAQVASKIQMRVDSNVLIEDEQLLETEAEIVPSNLHPQPPRRTRSLVHVYIPTEEYEYHQKEMYFENETQFMSDESSDSLLSASRCQMPHVEKPQPPPPMNNNRELLNTIMDARDKAILQEKRRQKKYEMMKALKRSESLQHAVPNLKLLEVNEIPTVKQNSFDGLYFVTNFSNTPTSTPVCHPKTKSCKSKDDLSKQKIKSKSLDRIDDGLDAMVDIIVTSDANNEQRLMDKSDSGHVTEATTVSRSTSNLYSQVKKDQTTKFSGNQQKYEEKHRIFLPINKYESRDVNESHFYFPRIQENSPNNFLIKRGHINAGLYSGHHIIRDSPPSSKKPSVISSNNYRSTSSRKNIIALGKLTDLPSGLY